MRPFLAVTCLLLLAVSTSFATTYVVHPDGTGDFPTIQAAIDACDHGDIVELTDGIFTGDENRDISYLGKAITVRSQSGDPTSCVIDCQGGSGSEHRGFAFNSGEGPGSVLQGVSIVNGYTGSYGAGISCIDQSSPTITDCIITQGFAENGGAVDCRDSSPTLVGCLFLNNFAYDCGGGMSCERSSPSIQDCVFSGNSAGGCGWPGAGGMHLDESSPTLTGCIFVNTGLAIFAGWSSSPTLTNCTLFANTTGIYLFASDAILDNTIFAFNNGIAVEGYYGDCADLSCCDVFGNTGGDWVGCIADQYGINGNISEDPMFCDTATDDYTLHADSPCAPANSGGCELIGAWPVGCGVTSVKPATWGSIKTDYKN